MQSVFMPFVKSRLTKGLDEQYSMLKDHLDQLAVGIHEDDKSCEF